MKASEDKIIVMRSPPPTKAGNIELPTGSAGAYNYGVVLAVGPFAKCCEPGDVVVVEAVGASPIARTGDPQEDAARLVFYCWPRNVLIVMSQDEARSAGLKIPHHTTFEDAVIGELKSKIVKAVNPAMV